MSQKLFPIDEPNSEPLTPELFERQEEIFDNPETDPDPALEQAEDRIAKLERILGDIAPGWQVQITRQQPGWAKGYLETVDVGEDSQPIDLEYLARTWGGDVLRLRVKDRRRVYVGGCDVHLYSYPPKRWGKPIRSPQEEQIDEKNGLGNLETVLSLVDRLKGKPELSTAELLQILLKSQKQAAPPQPDLMSQLLTFSGAIKQLRGIFGDDGAPKAPPAPAVDDGGMVSQLNGLLDTYLKIKASAEPPRRLVSEAVANPANPVISNALKTMDPKQIAEMFLGSVGNLQEEKRTEIFEHIFDMLGISADKTEDNDDDDDDETEE